MNKFIKAVLAFSLKNKFFIFFLTFLLVVGGYISFKNTPIDAFPDVTNTTVTIITQWPGRSAEEVEKFITLPIEIALNPAEKKVSIFSYFLFFSTGYIKRKEINWRQPGLFSIQQQDSYEHFFCKNFNQHSVDGLCCF